MKMLNTQWRRLSPVVLGAALAMTAARASGQPALTNVSVGSFFFNPSTVSIKVNGQVTWTWVGSPHSTTSKATPTPLWDSGVLGTGATFSHTFPATGSFPYFCTVHPVSMNGSITVQAAVDAPPTVAITNPASGAVLSAPAALTLAARASDSDGTVTNVQFFQGSTSLGNVRSSPYSVVVSSLAVGNNTFSAVAADNAGLKATNSIAVSVVTPVAITLSAPERLSATAVQFSYTANVGLKYIVFKGATLPNFAPISTNQAAASTVTFVDHNATGADDFYRVELAPNP